MACTRLSLNNEVNVENRINDHNKTRTNGLLYPYRKKDIVLGPEDDWVDHARDLELENAVIETNSMCKDANSCCSKVVIREITTEGKASRHRINQGTTFNRLLKFKKCN